MQCMVWKSLFIHLSLKRKLPVRSPNQLQYPPSHASNTCLWRSCYMVRDRQNVCARHYVTPGENGTLKVVYNWSCVEAFFNICAAEQMRISYLAVSIKIIIWWKVVFLTVRFFRSRQWLPNTFNRFFVAVNSNVANNIINHRRTQ